jgi:iron complex outermembrane recepter protein
MMFRIAQLRLAAALFAATAPFVVYADDPAPSDTPADSAGPAAAANTAPATEASGAPVALPQVTVTVNKQTQSLVKVPGSVSSIDSNFARSRSIGTFQELVDYTPNVTIAASGSGGQFIVRGLGTPDTNQGFDPSVGLVSDGVYYGRPQFLTALFDDIDRFEVLRGPQGTLFGKNSTAGIFNVVSQKPGRDWAADGELLARGYGDLSVRPAFTLPVSENLSLRVSGNFEHNGLAGAYNTYLKQPETNPQQDTGRLRGRYLGEGFSVDFGAFHSHQYQNNSNFVFTTLSSAMETAIRKYDSDFVFDPEQRKVSTNYNSQDNAMLDGAHVQVDVPLPGFIGMNNLQASSITAYARARSKNRDIDADFTPIPFIVDHLVKPAAYQQLSQEFRLSGSSPDLFGFGHGVQFITGVYLLQSRYDVLEQFGLQDLGGALVYCTAADPGSHNCNQNAPGGLGTIAQALAAPLSQLLPYLGPQVNDQNVTTALNQKESLIAGFGQFEYLFLENWALIGGLRYGTESKRAYLSAQASSQIVQAIANSDNFSDTLRRTERDYSPKGGIRYNFDKNASAYFTWARGYKSGGFNGLPLRSTQNEFGPERAGSYEFGAKGQFLDNRLRASMSLYTTDFDDLQLSTYQNNRFIVLNAGVARSQGFESDLQWLPEFAPFLLLRGSMGYADARYVSYPNAPCYSDAPDNCTQNLAGARLPFGSRWTGSFTPDVFFPLGNGLRGTVGADMNYRTSRYLDVDNDPRKLQAATTLYNAHLTINDGSQKWAFTFAVRNISNVLAFDQRLGQPLAPGNFASSGPTLPRTFLQSISYRF